MSLINQALRKAQHQRSPNAQGTPATPTQAATAGHHVGHHASPHNKSGLLLGLVAGIALLIGLVAGLLIVLLRNEPAPVLQQATVATGPTQTLAPEQPLFATSAPTAPTAQPTDQEHLSLLKELRTAREATEAKAAAEAAAAQAAEAAAAAPPSPDIIQWLAQARISGVRLSGSASKVILNNKAYAVGDTVNLSLGLKVLIIQENRILFLGPNGKKYLKQVL
jgi:hypothetical protein